MALSVPTAMGGEVSFKSGKVDLASLKQMPPSPQESSQVGTADDMAQ